MNKQNISIFKKPIISLISLIFIFTFFYFCISIINVNFELENIISQLEPNKTFSIFISNFYNLNILISSMMFILISLFFIFLTFLNNKEKLISSACITFISFLFFCYSLNMIHNNYRLMNATVHIMEELTEDSFLKKQVSSPTLSLLKNSKDYLEKYKSDKSMENTAKLMASFDILTFNNSGINSINISNVAIFTDVVKKHVQISINYSAIIRTTILLSMILLLINFTILLKAIKISNQKKDS